MGMIRAVREDRAAAMTRLCHIMGTTMRFIADPLLTMLGEPSIDPIRLEKWLARHGKGVEEGKSLRETLEQHYGKAVADLAESLV